MTGQTGVMVVSEPPDEIDTMTEAQIDEVLRHYGYDPEQVGYRSKVFAGVCLENARLRTEITVLTLCRDGIEGQNDKLRAMVQQADSTLAEENADLTAKLAKLEDLCEMQSANLDRYAKGEWEHNRRFVDLRAKLALARAETNILQAENVELRKTLKAINLELHELRIKAGLGQKS